MEAAKCRLCGERHYGLCKQFQEEVQKPLKKIKEMASEQVSVAGYLSPDKRVPITRSSGTCQCPCCVLRREKTKAAVAKFREKKKGSSPRR